MPRNRDWGDVKIRGNTSITVSLGTVWPSRTYELSRARDRTAFFRLIKHLNLVAKEVRDAD